MASALAVDLDGVIRRWPVGGDAEIEARFGLESGSMARVLFAPALLEAAVTGQISDDEWRRRAAANLSVEVGFDCRGAMLEAAKPFGAVDHDVLALVRRVRGNGGPVVLVTNATTKLLADLGALGIDDEFDAVINSSAVGFAKPDPRIYTVAAEAAGCAPGDCLFVDDTAGHVAAARAAGLHGHEFVSAAALTEELKGHGLI